MATNFRAMVEARERADRAMQAATALAARLNVPAPPMGECIAAVGLDAWSLACAEIEATYDSAGRADRR